MVFRRVARLGAASCLAFYAAAAQARRFFDFPTPVTPVAKETLYVHDLFLAIISVIFALSLSVLLYSVFVHRKSRGHPPAAFTRPATAKQWLWVISPFLALTFIDYVVLGIPAYHSVLAMADTRDNAAMVVKVTASQWEWQYEYPGENVKFTSLLSTPRDQIYGSAPKDKNFLLEVDHPLVLPTGKKIRILLTSTDVIHSWWVPAFGVKQDAIPGFLRETWVKIDTPGVYRGQCAELCGVGHAFMPVVVKAVSPQDFDTWLAQQKQKQAAVVARSSAAFTPQQLIARGRKVFDANCAACHQATGMGLPGAFPPIAAGQPFQASPQMIADLSRLGFYEGGKIMLGPVAQHLAIVLHGIPGTAMPAFGPQLSDADIASVITFERNDFGNHSGDVVQPAAVKAARAGH